MCGWGLDLPSLRVWQVGSLQLVSEHVYANCLFKIEDLTLDAVRLVWFECRICLIGVFCLSACFVN